MDKGKAAKNSCFWIWCRQRDLNSHELGSLPPQDSVSTNFTMSALRLFMVLLFSRFCIFVFSRCCFFVAFFGCRRLAGFLRWCACHFCACCHRSSSSCHACRSRFASRKCLAGCYGWCCFCLFWHGWLRCSVHGASRRRSNGCGGLLHVAKINAFVAIAAVHIA